MQRGKNVQIFHQNLIVVAETHVFTKPLTPNRCLLPPKISRKYGKWAKILHKVLDELFLTHTVLIIYSQEWLNA